MPVSGRSGSATLPGGDASSQHSPGLTQSASSSGARLFPRQDTGRSAPPAGGGRPRTIGARAPSPAPAHGLREFQTHRPLPPSLTTEGEAGVGDAPLRTASRHSGRARSRSPTGPRPSPQRVMGLQRGDPVYTAINIRGARPGTFNFQPGTFNPVIL